MALTLLFRSKNLPNQYDPAFAIEICRIWNPFNFSCTVPPLRHLAEFAHCLGDRGTVRDDAGR